ncbi:MAG TPA: hydrogenase expression/formation protein HypE [Candidatus Melainabacteria bacterium]|nr:hydrogenase expression/formation protein HypE [Candidatus Melainabacteria bacterium]
MAGTDTDSENSFKDRRIELAHGAGGKASRRLVEGLILPKLSNPILNRLSDSAIIDFGGRPLAFTTDSFVVKPLEFPGGSIGSLAVNGTVNDLAVSGSRPVALLATLILEAGTSTDVVARALDAMAEASAKAGVPVVGGDTKVVEHGKADGVYITTSGIGEPVSGVFLEGKSVCPGDKIILSGPVGDHGITVLLARGELDIEADLQSDSRSVWPFVEALLNTCGSDVRWMRDPTRGGVATSLNELAEDSGRDIVIEDRLIPVRDTVRGACEVLGLDVLHVANEGQFLAVVAAEAADKALAAIRQISGGEEAVIIGAVGEAGAEARSSGGSSASKESTESKQSEGSSASRQYTESRESEGSRGRLTAITPYGSSRIVDILVGDQLPRIC